MSQAGLLSGTRIVVRRPGWRNAVHRELMKEARREARTVGDLDVDDLDELKLADEPLDETEVEYLLKQMDSADAIVSEAILSSEDSEAMASELDQYVIDEEPRSRFHRSHRESLAQIEEEGDGSDTYRRMRPNHLPAGHTLMTIFSKPHWQRRRRPTTPRVPRY